jgi:hypothetical protein
MMKRSIGRVALLLLSALLVALLSSCGSGAVTGTDPSAGSTLAVFPGAADAFADIPLTLTISGGQSPYSVFSSNTVALPVTTVASGISGTNPSFSLVPTSVNGDTPVDVTIKDGLAKSVIAKVNVHPSTLNNQVTFTPLGPTGTGCGTGLCSGGDAQVVVKAVLNGLVLRSRAIRFDVYQGGFQLVTPGTGVLVSSLVINTDEQGEAVVRLLANTSVPTQVATLQSTDVSTGLARRYNFNIIQTTSGAGILSTLPSGTITIKGAKGGTGQDGFCPNARVDFYVYGGSPPYAVASPLPGVASPTIATVAATGGVFGVLVTGCGKVSMIVTDSKGLTIETAAIDSQQGDKGDAATATTLTIAPTAISVGCGQSASINLVGSGSFTTQIVTAGVDATKFIVSPTAGAIPSTITFSRSSAANTEPTSIVVNVVAGATVTPVTIATPATCP